MEFIRGWHGSHGDGGFRGAMVMGDVERKKGFFLKKTLVVDLVLVSILVSRIIILFIILILIVKT